MKEDFLGALHANPWAESFIDLSELNQEASALIEQGVLQLREQANRAPERLRTESLVLLGPPGTGKTHLFARVRKHCGPRAIFVHLRPLLHAGILPSYVLSEALHQLAQASFGREDSQADVLVGSLIARFEGKSPDFPLAHLSAFRELSAEARDARLEEFAESLLGLFPDLDDVFVERLLSLPFAEPRKRRALLAWLGGEDCDPSQLARIGAATSMDPKNTIRALRTLGSLAALGSPLVIVFDQLENLVQKDAVEERITQYGHLITELVDSTRGLLVVQMALDSEWERGILPRLNLSQRSRVSMRTAVMALPTVAQGGALLKQWVEHVPEPEGPFPWPLTSDQLERLPRLPGVTPRMLLCALKEAREGTTPSILTAEPSTSTSRDASDDNSELLWPVLADEWHERLVAAHQQIDLAEERRAGVDLGRLVDGILLASEFDGGHLRGTNDPYFQAEARTPGRRWLSLLHQAHHKSMNAMLDRVLARSPNERGVIAREQWRPVPPTWKTTQEKLRQTEAKAHLISYELHRAEVASLLALEDLLQLARSRDLCDPKGTPITEKQAIEYLREQVHPESWGLMAALRSEELTNAAPANAPSHLVPVAPLEGDVVACLRGALTRLRVASVDRLIREAQRLDARHTRSAVLTGLEQLGKNVTWFGRNVVAFGDES